MRRPLATLGLCVGLGGCASGPLADNPLPVGPSPVGQPARVALGAPDYATVVETVIDVLDDFFPVDYSRSSRYDGVIRTEPVTAPGLEQPWKPGSPDGPERLLATFQSIRYRAEVLVQPTDGGGYHVHVVVLRELEDVYKPVKATAGAAVFRTDATVDRVYEVVTPDVVDTKWIPLGREPYLEHQIVSKIERRLNSRK